MRFIKGRHITAALMILCLTWISCQQDEIDYNRVKVYPVVSNQTETVVETRALPSGYTAYSYNGQGQRLSLVAHAIAFNKTTNARETTKDVKNKTFTAMPDGSWRSTLEIEAGYKYNLYTHTVFPGASNYVLDYTANNTKVTFSGLNVIADSDPLVESAAAGKRLPDTDPASAIQANYPDLEIGVFSIGEVLPTTENDGVFRAFMALDHLFAKATLKFSVDAEYDALRTIRIKSAVIETTGGGKLEGTHSYSFTNNSVTLANTTASGNQQQVDLIQGPSSTVTKEGDANNQYVTLTTTPVEYGWFCFIASIKPNCKLTVTYDVYDKKGNLLSERTASNDKILERVTNPVRGSDYEINIKVNPTYLGQLSDGDVDSKIVLLVE